MLQIKEKFNLTKLLFEGNNVPISQPAVIWNDETITREELYNNVVKTSDYLLMIGVKQCERVVLLLDDTPAIYEFFLASIAIGSIPILINPKIKLSELEYILNDSGAKALVSEIRPLSEVEKIYESSSFLESRNKIIIQDRYVSDREIIRTNREYYYPRSSKVAFIEEEDRQMSFIERDKDAPAFWQYTSGTTGKPKAVVHSQISMLSNTVNFAEKTLKITKDDCIYSIPKMFFGYGLGNSLFFPLWTGASVIIDNKWPNIDRITNLIETHKPTVFFAVPKIYGALLKNNISNDFTRIRIFYSAGSNLNTTVNRKWKEVTGKYITQGIGCTEIGHVYVSTIPSEENINTTGKPIDGFKVKLNREEGEELGELYVQPPFKLLGYNNVENQNKFLVNNWYRTSDNFTQDKDENYIFSSRVDDMFKINGRMVAPSVVENFVLEHFPINEAVFLAIEDKTMSDVTSHLCLTLTNKMTNEEELIKAIKNDLIAKMPSYMRPQKISIFDGFEYNSNGKIIKKEIIEQLKQTDLV